MWLVSRFDTASLRLSERRRFSSTARRGKSRNPDLCYPELMEQRAPSSSLVWPSRDRSRRSQCKQARSGILSVSSCRETGSVSMLREFSLNSDAKVRPFLRTLSVFGGHWSLLEVIGRNSWRKTCVCHLFLVTL